MKFLLKLLAGLLLLLLIAATYFYFTINDYQTDGELKLTVLDAPVTVTRDQLHIPYIKANSVADALRAQGFITGQDRLYQAQLYRLIALGRLAEVFGESGLKNDILIRTIGIEQMAERQTRSLDQHARDYYTHYIEGLNSYITEQQSEHPVSVKMLGIKAEPWTLQDIVALQLFQAWSNGSNWRKDLLTQQVIDAVGVERAQQIAQVSVNPDDNSVISADLLSTHLAKGKHINQHSSINLSIDPALLSAIPDALSAGSNAWATGSRKSVNGKPILSNTPHLPTSALPGFWHPMGIFTPQLKVVGLSAPGTPGIAVGRTQHIAYGATVGGSDGADLYIERLDPEKEDHYLQGSVSLPLQVREETLLIKDKEQDSGFRQHNLQIRSTPRGPLISDHGIGTRQGRAISLRWAVAQQISPSLGSDRLIFARNLDEAREALKSFNVALSHVVVDSKGGIGRISTGRVPIRKNDDGSTPINVEQLADNEYQSWLGLIPNEEMPVELRPSKDWVGTANHRIIKKDYPYKFSKIFAVAWRYQRIKQVMEQSKTMSVDDHWALSNDLKNPMAEKLSVMFANGLAASGHQHLARLLTEWDHRDRADKVAPTLFQLINKHFVRLTFADELPDEIWPEFFDSIYVWQERFMLMLEENNHPWFNIEQTAKSESRDDTLQLAIDSAITELQDTLGDDQSQWQWGKLHTITFASPVIPGEKAANWLGAGTHPHDGTAETLSRGRYKMSAPYSSTVIDSVRFVADMADDDKVLAVIPGGTSGRYFDKSLSNQTEDWLAGKSNVIWFSQEKVKENAQHQLTLIP